MLRGVLRVIQEDFTFPRDYVFGESVEVMSLPYRARIVGIKISAIPANPDTLMGYNALASVGTNREPEAFSQYYSEFGDSTFSDSMGFDSGFPMWYRSGAPIGLMLTFRDTFNGKTGTEGLAGKTIRVHVEFAFGV